MELLFSQVFAKEFMKCRSEQEVMKSRAISLYFTDYVRGSNTPLIGINNYPLSQRYPAAAPASFYHRLIDAKFISGI
jgi:hypothetical protein